MLFVCRSKVEPQSVLAQAKISAELKNALLDEDELMGLVDYMLTEGKVSPPWELALLLLALPP